MKYFIGLLLLFTISGCGTPYLYEVSVTPNYGESLSKFGTKSKATGKMLGLWYKEEYGISTTLKFRFKD